MSSATREQCYRCNPTVTVGSKGTVRSHLYQSLTCNDSNQRLLLKLDVGASLGITTLNLTMTESSLEELWLEEMFDISSWVGRLEHLARLIFRDTWSFSVLQDLMHASESLAERVSTWRSLVDPEINVSSIARRRISTHSSTDREIVAVREGVLTYLRWLSLLRAARVLETFVLTTANLSSSITEELKDLWDVSVYPETFQPISFGDGERLEPVSQEILMQSLRDYVMEESLGFRMSHLSGLMESVRTPEELFSMSLTGRAAWPTSSRYWTDILSRFPSREDLLSSGQDGFLSPLSFVLSSIMEGMHSGPLFAEGSETMANALSIDLTGLW